MEIIRTRFGRDIVAEVALPPRRHKRGDKVLIVCNGMPSMPPKREILTFFAKKGFVVIYPRYRGSWESAGAFLKVSPEKDILKVVDVLGRGFTDFWNNKHYDLNPQSIFVIGISFGGPAAILASRDKRIAKVIAVSPVVDWQARSRAEPLDWLYEFVRNAFGEGYRVSKKNWNKLKSGTFYNPMHHVSEIDGSKIYIFHAKDDESVGWRSVDRFAKKTGCKLSMLKRGGHLSSLLLTKPAFYKRVDAFFKN